MKTDLERYVFQDFMGDDWNRLRQGKGWIWFQFSSWRRALRISNVLMILHLQSNSTLERVALRCELNVRKYQDTEGFQQQMRLHTATKWSDQNCKLSHVYNCNFQWIKQECSSTS